VILEGWLHPADAPPATAIARRAFVAALGYHAVAASILAGGGLWPLALAHVACAVALLAAARLGDPSVSTRAALLALAHLVPLGTTAALGQGPAALLMYLPLAALAIQLLPEAMRLQGGMVGLSVAGLLLCDLWPLPGALAASAGAGVIGGLHLTHVGASFALVYAAHPAAR
jgi:hypothetical protein